MTAAAAGTIALEHRPAIATISDLVGTNVNDEWNSGTGYRSDPEFGPLFEYESPVVSWLSPLNMPTTGHAPIQVSGSIAPLGPWWPRTQPH